MSFILHFLLVTVGNLAKLFDSHGLFLDVILCEQARLARHHLLDWCRNHQIIYVVIRSSRLPFLWWDNLRDKANSELLLS